MITAIFIITAIYLVMLICFGYGWQKIQECKQKNRTYSNSFSVIVPFRNEEKNILHTLEDICEQQTESAFELILVNDHSEDRSLEIVHDYLKNKTAENISILNVEEGKWGKKEALLTAAAVARYPWLVFTDADCRRKNGWLNALAAFTEKKDAVMVSMPVSFREEKNWFEKIQSLEFLSLNGIGAATLTNGYPTMCNGANLALRKEVFTQSKAYNNRDKVASGDDEFLLHEVFSKYPKQVFYLKAKEAIVTTHALKSFPAFVSQRKRWVSKSRHYNNPAETFMQLVVFIFHALLLSLLVAGIFSGSLYFQLFLIIFGMKLLFETIFISPVAKFFNKRKLLYYYPISGFLYIFYVVFIAFGGNIGGYIWKGRKLT